MFFAVKHLMFVSNKLNLLFKSDSKTGTAGALQCSRRSIVFWVSGYGSLYMYVVIHCTYNVIVICLKNQYKFQNQIVHIHVHCTGMYVSGIELCSTNVRNFRALHLYTCRAACTICNTIKLFKKSLTI